MADLEKKGIPGFGDMKESAAPKKPAWPAKKEVSDDDKIASFSSEKTGSASKPSKKSSSAPFSLGGEGKGFDLSAVSNVYYALEDKYYAFLDKLQARGLPVYKVVDKIDKYFPSFILLLLILLILLLLFMFVAVPFVLSFFGPKIVLFKVVDEGSNPLENVSLSITQKGQTNSFMSDAWGLVETEMLDANMLIEAIKEGYIPYNETVTPDTETENEIILSEEPTSKMLAITVKDASTGQLLSGKVNYTFSCSGGSSNTPPALTGADSEKNITVLFSCNMLSVTAASEGYTNKTISSVNVKTRNNLDIRMTPKEKKANLTVKVYDYYEDDPLSGITVKLKKIQGESYVDTGFSERTDATGSTRFDDLPIGTYYAVAEDTSGEYKSSIADDGEIVLVDGDEEQLVLKIKPLLEPQKIMLKFVDANNSSQEIKDVAVYIFKKSDKYELLDIKVSTSDGVIEKLAVDPDYNYFVVASHKEYVTKVIDDITLVDEADDTPQVVTISKATSLNSGRIEIFVDRYKDNKSVEGAIVNLYSVEHGFYLATGSTSQDGLIDFNNLAPGRYYAMAFKSSEDGRSNTEQLRAGETLRLNITLVLSSQKFTVTVKDNLTGSIIQDAIVSFFDSENDLRIEEAVLTNNHGKAEKEIKMDRAIYVRVQKENYLAHTTVPYAVSEVKAMTVYLYKESEFPVTDPEFDMELFGVYDDVDEKKVISALDDDDPADTDDGSYWFKFRVIVLDNNYADFYSVIRAGLQENLNATDSIAVVTDALFAGSTVTAMGCYDTQNHYADCENMAISPGAKQVVFYSGELTRGVYDLFVKLYIKEVPDEDEAQTLIQVRYGTKADDNVSDVTAFRPKDGGLYLFEAYLGESICTLIRDECPIEYKLTLSGPTAFMPDPIQVAETPIEILLDEGYNLYTLDYEIYNATKDSFADVVLSITDRLGAMSDAKIFDLDNATQEIESVITESIADFSKGVTLYGTISFKALLESEGAEIILGFDFSREDSNITANFVVMPVRDIIITPIPTHIYGDVNNSMKFKVKDDRGDSVEDAQIEIILDDQPQVSLVLYNEGLTDFAGNFYTILPAASPGTRFEVIAKKPGYNDGDINLVVLHPLMPKPGAMECIDIDQNHFEPVLRGDSVTFNIMNNDCGESVSLKLRRAIGTDITVSEEEFELDEGEDIDITVQTDRWLGVHPVFVEAKAESDFDYYIINVVELYITDADSCYQIENDKFDYNVFHRTDEMNVFNDCYTGYDDEEHMSLTFPESVEIIMTLLETMEISDQQKFMKFLMQNRGEKGTTYVLMTMEDYVCGHKSGSNEIMGCS